MNYKGVVLSAPYHQDPVKSSACAALLMTNRAERRLVPLCLDVTRHMSAVLLIEQKSIPAGILYDYYT